MAAGGFKEFVAGEVLDQDEINDYLMQGVLVFAGTAARGSAITSPVEGQFSFLKDSDTVEFYDGSGWVEYSGAPPLFDFLVVGGGGGGGARENRSGSGGGAGGYRNSVTGELSGGSAVAEPSLFLPSGSFTVTVGAGGAVRSFGSPSRFAQIIAYGGGRGNGLDPGGGVISAGAGGSGAGEGGDAGSIGTKLLNQGSDGGTAVFNSASGGGGGAGAVGGNATSGNGGAGGAGLSSSITGSAVTRGGGGGGGANGTGGAGGSGGGGAGGASAGANGTAGDANTGGGGGGSGYLVNSAGGSTGGSGIVVIKYPSSITLTIGGGLTSSTSTSGLFKITTFTAGTDTVSF